MLLVLNSTMSSIPNVNNQIVPSQQLHGVNAADWAAKFASKVEAYRFVASEVGAFLDSYETMTIWHIRDLCSGKRRMILAKDAKHYFVPHYEDLSKEEILSFAAKYP